MRTATILIVIGLLGHTTGAFAQERLYALGVGIYADDGDGLGTFASGDIGFTEATGGSLSVGVTRAGGDPEDIRSRFWQLGVDHDFGPIGAFARFGQSGDPDDFDSDDAELGLYVPAGNWRFTGRYLRRDVDLVLRLINTDPIITRTVETQADGFGFAARYRAKNRFSAALGLRRYDFDRDLTRLNQFEVLRRLSPTTLTLSGSLLDSSYTAGVEIPFGQRALSLSVARDRLAAEQRDVDSVTVGWLTPVGDRSDLDVSIGISNDDAPDGAGENVIYLNVLYLFYGLF